jgi:hypothetical protein
VGEVSPLNGQVLNSAPVTGTILRSNPQNLTLAFLFHSMSCNASGNLNADTLNGSVSFDCGLDGSFEAEHPFNHVSCEAGN